mmetsp:Transcript_120814/g.352914  ORF Transcript_120814/g.352914 Transcript_120814/m.352914 type:complete len:770 (-) Transcript_120814:157-2466(-)
MLKEGVVDVTQDSGDDVAEVVDISGDSDDGIAEEAPLGAPPYRFRGYRRGRELGRGASGQVFICKRRGCRSGFAVKAVDLRKMRLSPHVEREQKKLRREVEILKSLPPHPCIVQLVDACEGGDWFLLVLELVGGGDLYTVLTSREPARLLEREAAFVLEQLADGLRFLHGQCIIHRDLKLENVLVASERKEGSLVFYGVKITDFGLSKAIGVGLSEALSTVGTQPYIAPEVMSTRSYDFRSDLWCLGVLLYVLLAGQFPFEKISTEQGDIDRVVTNLKVSETARSVVQGLLRLEPTARLCLQDVSTHRWLQDGIVATSAERPAKRHCTGPQEKLPSGPSSPALSLGSNGSVGTEALFGSTDVLVMAKSAPPAPPMPPLDPTTGESLDEVPHPAASTGRPFEQHLEGPRRDSASVAEEGDATLALGEVRPASPQPDVIQVHVVVSDSASRHVLAQSGARLKDIARNANCEVWMTSQEENGLQHIVIIGRCSECVVVQEFWRSILLEDAEHEHHVTFEVVLLVRAEAAGVVIGKQGFCLQQIQHQSGARIRLLRKEVQGQRPCIITGALPSVLQAERHISDLVRAVPTASGDVPSNGRPSAVLGSASSTRLLLPSDLAGAVVGKHGFGLRQIRERCGVKVQMLHKAQAPQWPNSRVLVLRGPLASRQAALGKVLELSGTVGGGTCILQIIAPASQAKAVLERRVSATLGLEQSNTSIVLDSKEVQSEQVVVVSGLHDGVLGAAAGVLQTLERTECTLNERDGTSQDEMPVT